ncbi:MAG: transcription termination/antitermination NusG family protein [Desulfonatronovibrionaceae bacterium]
MTIPLDRNPEQAFPENVLKMPLSEERPWRIAHVKSRREKALAAFLAGHSTPYFLPLIKKRQPGQARKRYSLVPIFTGYIFFMADNAQRYQALTSGQIANIIEIKDQARLVHELVQVKEALQGEMPVYPYDYVREGQMVRITQGPMQNLQGIVESKKNNYRLILRVSCIMQAVAMDIDADWIEPL